MKKKILFTVFVSLSIGAKAEVTIYGRLAVALENDQFQNTTVPGTSSVQDFGSYFGLRGTDSVYGETAAIWQVEQFLDLTSGQPYYSTTGGGMIVPRDGVINLVPQLTNWTGRVSNMVNTLASSESYLGLSGGWGSIKIGNLSDYMRSDQGSVDIYSYGNGVDGLGTYSRTVKLIPTALSYNSPRWGGFGFTLEAGFNTSGQTGVSGISSTNDFGAGLNGLYSGSTYSAGASWKNDIWNVSLGGILWQTVGTYTSGAGGMNIPSGFTNNVYYPNAYASRLEVGYNNPDGFLIGAGFQVANGIGWAGWANSGGSLGNITYNAGVPISELETNQYGTQETALSIGWHLGAWTPKVGYVYGNNLMRDGNFGNYIDGSANQIKNSGYQQAVAEIDCNITPRTIVFINYGQIFWGSTLQNISFRGDAVGDSQGVVNGSNQYLINQATAAIGFSHTF